MKQSEVPNPLTLLKEVGDDAGLKERIVNFHLEQMGLDRALTREVGKERARMRGWVFYTFVPAILVSMLITIAIIILGAVNIVTLNEVWANKLWGVLVAEVVGAILAIMTDLFNEKRGKSNDQHVGL